MEVNQKFINACLSTFGGVLEGPLNKEELIIDYGVVISPNASYAITYINEWLKEECLKGEEINNAFHKSWNVIKESTHEELLTQQLIHYFTTYGLESLGLYDESYVYIPNEVLDVPEALPLKVIKGLSKDEFINRSLDLLRSGMALKQTTIESLLDILDGCDYKWDSLNGVKNREARTLISDKTGILPLKGSELFRYIFYKAIGKTLVINSKEMQWALKNSNYEIPMLTDSQVLELSKSFNRHKDLWLSLRQGSKKEGASNNENVRIINRIAKLSKKHHIPMSEDVLSFLTSRLYSEDVIAEAASKATAYRLIRCINAVRLYAYELEDRLYRIRNNKGWTHKRPSLLTEDTYCLYEDVLLDELRSRVKSTKVYYPPHVDYGLPVSEKAYVGNIPRMTCVTLPKGEEYFLVGVHWSDAGDKTVDLDIDGQSESYTVAFNYSLKEDGLMHSGDVTAAPHGASEYIYGDHMIEPTVITLKRYGGPKEHPFQLIAGYGNDVEEDYLIDPNKVVFQGELISSQDNMILGMLLPSVDGGVQFILIGQGGDNSRFIHSSKSAMEKVRRNAMLSSMTSSLRLSDVIPSVPTHLEADIDLSPQYLGKDSIMSLFTK